VNLHHCSLISFLLLVLFVNPAICYGQQTATESVPGYDIQHFTAENGLPQNSVKSIAADQRGNIWLATEKGIVRYDGKRFATFGQFGGSYLDESIESFLKNPVEQNGSFFAVNADMTFIRIANNQAVNDSGFYSRIFGHVPFIEPRTNNWYIARGIPNPNIGHIFPQKYIVPAGAHRYYVYDNKHLQYFEQGKRIKQTVLPDKSFWGFFRIDNELYLAENGGFVRFSGTGPSFGTHARLIGDALKHPRYDSQVAPVIFWSNCTNQVFMLLGNSLYALSPTGDGHLTSHKILEGFDFRANNILAIYYDQKAQRIFLGSQLNGLFVLRKKTFTTLTSDLKGDDNVYYGQALYGGDSVLAAPGRVFTFDQTNRKLSIIGLPRIAGKIWWDKTGIMVDRRGDIWCKQGVDLYRFDHTGKILKKHWNVNIEFTQLYEGKDGTIWVGSSAAGLFRIDPEKADAPLVRLYIGNFRNISWIQEQSDGVLWVATGNGLFKVHIKSRKIFYIKGLENIYVKSLYIPQGQDEIWITTYKDGVFLLKKGILTHFPLDKQKSLASAHCVIEDSKGFFWISTNNGLFQVKKADLLAYATRPYDIYYYYYSKADGFQTNEFNGRCQPCAVKLPTGFISLPSLNGLVWFKPENVVPDLPDKAIMIDRIMIDGRDNPSQNRDIIFKQENTQLKIVVTTAFFGNPHNMELSYALTKKHITPSASNWLDINNNDGAISISQLSQGDYTIHLRKQNGFGRKNYAYKTINIVVPSEWYQTWWFYSVCSITAALLIFLFVRRRIKAVNDRNVQLENQIAVRTRELSGTLERLEESQSEVLQQIHLQSRLVASIAHDVRAPLSAAATITREMRKRIQRQQYDEALEFSGDIEDAIINIKGSLEDLLAYVKIQVYKREVKKEPVSLYNLVEKKFQLFRLSGKDQPNTFINEVPRELSVQTSLQLLDVIIHNIVDNANKFADGGSIKASVISHTDGLRFVIEDTGGGVAENLVVWMNDPQLTIAPSNYNGIGLMIIKELTPFVADRLTMERRMSGTTVTMYFS
jgi:signal transduction histidine kinase